MSEASFRELQSRVDALVERALSRDVDLGMLMPEEPNLDETERVIYYVLHELNIPAEAARQLATGAVIHELQRRDVLNGRDPEERVKSDLRQHEAREWARTAAAWSDEHHSG